MHITELMVCLLFIASSPTTRHSLTFYSLEMPVADAPRNHYYEVLGVSTDASEETIRAAYKRLVRFYLDTSDLV